MVITRQIVAIHSAKRTFRMFIAEAFWQTDIIQPSRPGLQMPVRGHFYGGNDTIVKVCHNLSPLHVLLFFPFDIRCDSRLNLSQRKTGREDDE